MLYYWPLSNVGIAHLYFTMRWHDYYFDSNIKRDAVSGGKQRYEGRGLSIVAEEHCGGGIMNTKSCCRG